jgi:hypothetical protein
MEASNQALADINENAPITAFELVLLQNYNSILAAKEFAGLTGFSSNSRAGQVKETAGKLISSYEAFVGKINKKVSTFIADIDAISSNLHNINDIDALNEKEAEFNAKKEEVQPNTTLASNWAKDKLYNLVRSDNFEASVHNIYVYLNEYAIKLEVKNSTNVVI